MQHGTETGDGPARGEEHRGGRYGRALRAHGPAARRRRRRGLRTAGCRDAGAFRAGAYSARGASLTDPQHRLFLETAWEALEDAGYDPGTYPGAIGAFGGCELSTYLYQLSRNLDTLGYVDGMQLMVTNHKDHLRTQVSYRLNLRGPSSAISTC